MRFRNLLSNPHDKKVTELAISILCQSVIHDCQQSFIKIRWLINVTLQILAEFAFVLL
jgi:hypothetical protein